MAEQQRSELGPQKRSLKLSAALGDWTTYKPQRILIKRVKSGLFGFDRLSKDELEEAHRIHYRFAEKFCEALKTDLGLSGEIFSVDAIQSNYSSFFKGLSQPLVELRHEEAFFSIEMTLANTLINSLLGSRDLEQMQRELTEAETGILETGLANYQSLYIFPESKFKIVSSPHPNPSPSLSANSSFVYFSLELKLNDAFGKIIFGYPAKLLKNLLNKIKETQKAALRISRLPAAIMGQTSQELKTILGITQISSGDLKSLEEGDVLLLDQSIYSALTAKLDGQEIILGQPGVKNGKIALKIIAVEKEHAKAAEVKVAPPPTIEEKMEEAPALTPTEAVEEEPFYPEESAQEEETQEELPEEEFEEEYPEEDFSEEETEENFEDFEDNLGEEEK